MRRKEFVLGALAVLVAGPSLAQGTAKKSVSAMDEKFMMDAAQGGRAEVVLGQLAADKASRDEVKSFGRMMVEDHSKANRELEALATQKQVTLPAYLKKEHQALHDRLSGMSGPAFDDAYMSAMVKDHVEDVAAFSRESKSGRDADVKGWAGQTLPTLQKHLEQAKSLAPKAAGSRK